MISINQPTVVLFDVDGTLIDCGGAGRRAMEATFRELDANTDALGFTFAGLTDRAIVRSGLRTLKRGDDDASIDGVIARYLEHLAAELPRSEGYRILAGVSELLGRLASIEGLVVGLGTGNVEPGARAKLRRGGLDRSFAFGGFGSDHEDRARLLEVGATRGGRGGHAAGRACRPRHRRRVRGGGHGRLRPGRADERRRTAAPRGTRRSRGVRRRRGRALSLLPRRQAT